MFQKIIGSKKEVVKLSDEKAKMFVFLAKLLRHKGYFKTEVELSTKVKAAEAKKISEDIKLEEILTDLVNYPIGRKIMKVINVARILIYIEEIIYPRFKEDAQKGNNRERSKTLSAFIVNKYEPVYQQCSESKGVLFSEIGGQDNLLFLINRLMQNEKIENNRLRTPDQKKVYLKKMVNILATKIFEEYEFFNLTLLIMDEKPIRFYHFVRKYFPNFYSQAQDKGHIINQLAENFDNFLDMAIKINPRIPRDKKRALKKTEAINLIGWHIWPEYLKYKKEYAKKGVVVESFYRYVENKHEYVYDQARRGTLQKKVKSFYNLLLLAEQKYPLILIDRQKGFNKEDAVNYIVKVIWPLYLSYKKVDFGYSATFYRFINSKFHFIVKQANYDGPLHREVGSFDNLLRMAIKSCNVIPFDKDVKRSNISKKALLDKKARQLKELDAQLVA